MTRLQKLLLGLAAFVVGTFLLCWLTYPVEQWIVCQVDHWFFIHALKSTHPDITDSCIFRLNPFHVLFP